MKRIFVLILFAIACISAGAQQINEQQALEKAQAFMKSKQFKSSNKVRSLSRARSKAADKESMYVFNVENKGGFVIVSGDERTEPILGYSTSGEIDYDNMTDNLRTWLEGYEAQIKAINENPKLARKKTGSEKAAIAPLIQTKWGQGSPYNLQCPSYNGFISLSGCVATALAQVMYYHKWPNSCSAIPEYTTTTREIVMEELPATTFEWDKMKTSYDEDETGEAADAVAKLMLYCGQAMLMDYARDDGSATVLMPYLLEKYFDYSPNMKRLFRKDYTTVIWENMVYKELSEGRPVLYSGNMSENGSGHEFICDGYDGAGLFHINWGWDGDSNGFFSLSVAFVDDTSDINGFTFSQKAIIGVEPSNKVEKVVPEVLLSQDVSATFSQRMRNSVDDDFDDVRVATTVDAWYLKPASSDFSFEIGWGLYIDGNLVKVLDSHTVTTGTDQTQYEFNNSATLSFGAGIEDADCKLCPIYKFPDNDEWLLCEGSVTNYVRAKITSTSVILSIPDTYTHYFSINSIKVPEDAEAGSEVTFTVNVTNNGNTMNAPFYLWIEKDYVWKDVATAVGYIEPGETGDVKMKYVPEDGGTYKVKVTNSRFANLYGAQEYSVNINYETISFKINEVEFSDSPAVGEQVEMYVHFTNDSQKTKQTMYLWNSPQGDDEWYEIGSWNGFVEPGNSSTARLVFVPDNTGNYYLRITTDSGGNDVKGTWTISVGSYEDHIVDGFKYSCNTVSKTAKLTGVEGYDVSQGIVIPETIMVGGEEYTVTSIGERAFSLGYYLEDYDQIPFIKFPKTLKSIGKYAFQDCGLSNYQFGEYHKIVIPEGVVSIGESAFHQLSGLYVLELPSTLRTIGPRAFYNNSHLKLIISHVKEPMAISREVFFNLEYGGGADLVVDAGTKGLYQQAEGWKEYPFHIIEGEVQQIDGLTYALDNSSATASVVAGDCEGMKRIVVPSTVSYNGDYTVDAIGCGAIPFIGIDYLELPASIKAIRPSAFFRSSIHKAVSYMDNPPKFDEYAIADTLFVPIGSKDKYQENWVFEENSVIYEGEYKERVVNELKYWCATGENFAHVIRGDYANMEDVVIPPAVDIDGKSYTVTVIDNHAFANYNIHSVTFPNTIDSIGRSAFEMTSLESLTLPSSLKTLGSRAFAFCQQLKTIDLPEGLVTLMDQAFNGCISLEELELPSTLKSIDSNAFSLYHSLKKITSHIVNPFPINEYTFTMRTEDGGYKWMESTILFVPEGSLERYKSTEGWNKFSRIYEGEMKEANIDGITYSYMTGPKTATVVKWDYINNNDFDTVNISETVNIDGVDYTIVAIGNEAFISSSNLKSLTLPGTVKSIGFYAFYGTCLKEVVIPEGVETICNQAFFNSYYMEKVVLPSTLKNIGSEAFRNPNKLENMVICHLTEPIVIPDDAFDFDISTLYVDEGMKESFVNADVWNLFSDIKESIPDETKSVAIENINYTYTTVSKVATVEKGEYGELTSVEIPSSISVDGVDYEVRKIEESAFGGYENLTSVTLPNTVTEIGDRAFINCSLESIKLPDHLKSIGAYAFYNCYKMKGIVLPESLESIGEHCFDKCYEITEINIPSKIVNIPDYAFNNCRPTELIIPEGVKTIGAYAFSCLDVEYLELPSTLTSIGEWAFTIKTMKCIKSHVKEPFAIDGDMVKLIYGTWISGTQDIVPSPVWLFVPSGTVDKYRETEGWNDFSVIVEGSPVEYADDAFEYLCAPESKRAMVMRSVVEEPEALSIPETIKVDGVECSVTNIRVAAFDGKRSVKSVKLPNTLLSIGHGAFGECSQIETLDFPEGMEEIGISAFSFCYGLKKVVLPSTLKSIGKGAFLDCPALAAVIAHMDNPFEWEGKQFAIYKIYDAKTDDYVVEGQDGLETPPTLYVPKGKKSLYQSLKGWGLFPVVYEGDPEEVTVGELKYSCATGSKDAMVIQGDYKALENVIIPSTISVDGDVYNVTAIGEKAFDSCRNLKSVSIPGTVEIIFNNAFNWTGLTSITIPGSVKTIGSNVFYSCTELGDVKLLEGVEVIGRGAFFGCNNMKIELPSTICRIRGMECPAKEVVSHIMDPYDIPDDAFVSKAKLYVPKGTKDKYLGHTGWMDFNNIEEMDLKYDVNNDSYLNALDILEIINYIAGHPSEAFVFDAADANNDGKVDIADLIMLSNKLVNR